MYRHLGRLVVCMIFWCSSTQVRRSTSGVIPTSNCKLTKYENREFAIMMLSQYLNITAQQTSDSMPTVLYHHLRTAVITVGGRVTHACGVWLELATPISCITTYHLFCYNEPQITVHADLPHCWPQLATADHALKWSLLPGLKLLWGVLVQSFCFYQHVARVWDPTETVAYELKSEMFFLVSRDSRSTEYSLAASQSGVINRI